MPPALEWIADGSVTSPPGFTAGAAAAGLKAGDALDVGLLVCANACATAGVFTRNLVRAAPVLYDQEFLGERPGRVRAVAVNARVANACTGADGLSAARAMAEAAERAAGLPPRSALVLSTGVIGVPLPVARVADGLRAAAERLSPAGGTNFARAMMTTDTRPKHCAVRFPTPNGPVTVGGVAKGAGMIHPDMATLLAVLTTDAAGEPATLAPLLRRVADRSFNAISIDGDTSTNDTVLLLANGVAGVDPSRDAATWTMFEAAVLAVARWLALAIVRDGEGATRFLEIRVSGAPTEAAAREVGRAVARSTLVKTALHGGDPNWGRVLAAAGAAGVTLVPDRLRLDAAGAADREPGPWLRLAEGGRTAGPDAAAARAVFTAPSVVLRLDLGIGSGESTVWTCDLSADYVRINADYTS
jgi:glutamate N-acetyltransferase/amino-acid N-acetyltransferase